ncbi:MAG: CCA tRNA nucleotidyltransferase [Thermoanaerobaculia bacterium]
MTRIVEFPNPQRRAIDVVKEVAIEKECRPFLVGGPVRDLLLSRNILDLDLTLEEGSSTLARALAKRIEGRVRSFPQFLTYKVTSVGFPEIDIATARKERYRSPGSLPTVTAGSLKDDLLRRDFSINAMALDLINGSIHDPADGQSDLAARAIRVLHDQSFIDDPTRAFRAIRLARRLGFTIEPHSAALMRDAISSGALSTISKERLWRELFLAMDERDAPKVLASLHKEGALAGLFSADVAAPDAEALERLRRQVEDQPGLDRYVLYTGVLLRGSDATAAHLEGSGFSQKRARNTLQIARDLARFEKALSEAATDRQRFRLLKKASPELLTLVGADRPAERDHVSRFQEFQRFKLPLRGNELEVPGGPHVARALERTREAVFTGEITADQARTFAREMAIQYLSREQPAEHK